MSSDPKQLMILKENLPTIESLIRINAPANISNDIIKAKALEELSHFQALAIQKPEILDCEPISVLLAVKQVIKKNLSLDPSQGLVYVMVGSVRQKDGTYVKVLETPETANGKISVARQSGRILDIKRPKIEYGENGETVKVTVEFMVPSTPAPRWEVIEFNKSHFHKWRTASHKKNSRNKADANERDYSNPLYRSFNGGIDPEFAATKCIRHALNKLGTNINESSAPLRMDLKPINVVSQEANKMEATEEFTDYTNIPNAEDL